MPPLEGIRVIDLTRVLAGPFCTMMLGDMGADVIKIEEPAHGDESRGWAPIVGEWSSYFLGVNRNKKSVALDLKHPEHAAALRSLIIQADVLVENFRPGSSRNSASTIRRWPRSTRGWSTARFPATATPARRQRSPATTSSSRAMPG